MSESVAHPIRLDIPPPTRVLTFAEFFAGIGLMWLGLERAGASHWRFSADRVGEYVRGDCPAVCRATVCCTLNRMPLKR